MNMLLCSESLISEFVWIVGTNGALGMKRELGLGFQRLGFWVLLLIIGDLGKSCYLSLICPLYKIEAIIPYLTDKLIIRICDTIYEYVS